MKSDRGAGRFGRVRRAGQSLALALPLALAPVPAVTGTSGANGSPAGPRGARTAAGRLLARIVLPRAARRGGSPTGSNPGLHGPGSQPANPDMLDLHGFWHLRGDPAAVIAWVEAHPPNGASVTRSGVGTVEGAPAVWYADFAFHPPRGRFASEALLVTLARASRGGTLLRADAQVIWMPALGTRRR